MDPYLSRTSEPEGFDELLRFVGAAASTPVKKFGRGVSVSRTGVGVWQLTFTDPPGNFVSCGYMLQDTTPSVVKGWTVTLGDFDATGKIVSLSIWNSSFAATDLAATSKLMLSMRFKRADASI